MSKPREERFRKRYHKNAHDRKQRDPFWGRLSFEELGLLAKIEVMVASTVEGDESGVLHGEDGRKISVDEFLFLIGGDEERVKELMKRLCRARQLDARRFDSGTIKLLHWDADQELPATGDAERKQRDADAKMIEEAQEFVPVLQSWFAAHGKERVLESDLLSFIKKRRGGYKKTQIRFLNVLYDEGVLVTDSSSLASLALPPSGVGVGAGSSGVGAGQEIVPDGKFPADQEPEPKKDSPSGIQLVPVGGRAGARPCLEEEGGRASEGISDAPPVPGAHGAGSIPSGDFVDDERPIMPAERIEDCCFEPADAGRVSDPLQAAERILCETPGWNSVPPRKGVRTDRPLSQHALLALNHQLREEHGPKIADAMWRTALARLIEDMQERRAYRKAPPNSWTALFSSWLKKMRPEDVVDFTGRG